MAMGRGKVKIRFVGESDTSNKTKREILAETESGKYLQKQKAGNNCRRKKREIIAETESGK